MLQCLYSDALRITLQGPMPPRGVGPQPQQEFWIYAGNLLGMPYTVGLSGLNQSIACIKFDKLLVGLPSSW